MALRIIAVGKKHESWVSEGIERYQKRLRAPFAVEWVLLPHSRFDGDKARLDESQDILSRLKPGETVILLDERGKLLDSPGFSAQISTRTVNGESIALVIGGAYGVDETVRQRAALVWSLSPLVLPHQLVRLVLVEQLYRAQQFAVGGSYHHE